MGTLFTLFSAEKGRKETKKAKKIQEKVRQVQDARSRIAQVREARMAQAEVIQGGATQGAGNSSAVQGGYSAIGSNMENNIQFINQMDSMQEAINRRMESAGNWQNASAISAQLTSMAASAAGGSAPASKPAASSGGFTSSPTMPRVGPR